jgi:hypothetical protein
MVCCGIIDLAVGNQHLGLFALIGDAVFALLMLAGRLQHRAAEMCRDRFRPGPHRMHRTKFGLAGLTRRMAVTKTASKPLTCGNATAENARSTGQRAPSGLV